MAQPVGQPIVFVAMSSTPMIRDGINPTHLAMTWGWHKWPFVEATKDEKRHRTKAVKATKDERTLKEAACRRLGRRCEGQILKTLRIFVVICCLIPQLFLQKNFSKILRILVCCLIPSGFLVLHHVMSRILIIPPSAWSQNHDQSSGTRQPQSQCVSLQTIFFRMGGYSEISRNCSFDSRNTILRDVFGTLNLCVEPQFQPDIFFVVVSLVPSIRYVGVFHYHRATTISSYWAGKLVQ